MVILEENQRLDKDDPDAILFEEFLIRLRDGLNNDDDYNLLRAKCSYYSMGDTKWKNNGFDDNDTIHIYRRNSDVLSHNNERIKTVGYPIALIQSKNTI